MSQLHPNFLHSILVLACVGSPICNAANHTSSQETTAPTLAASPSLNADNAPCSPAVLSAVYANMLRIQARRTHPEAIPAHTDTEQRDTDLVPLYLELIHWRRTPEPSIEEMNQLLGNLVKEGKAPYLELKFKAPLPQVVRYEFSGAGQQLQFSKAVSNMGSICTPEEFAAASQLDLPFDHFDSSVLTLRKSILNDTARIHAASSDCLKEIKQIYNSGGNLASKAIKKYLTPLAIWNARNKTPFHDFLFFHYTSATSAFSKILNQGIKDRGQAQLQAFENRSYDKIFSYLHSADTMFFLKNHYMAADPKSSASYGPYRATFEMDPRTPVLDILPERGGNPYEGAFSELRTRYPSLEKCSESLDKFLIQQLAAEDSGVGLVVYVHPTYRTDTTWVQIPDSRFITGSYGEKVK